MSTPSHPPYSLTDEQCDALYAAAREGANHAYAPYSNFHVGAALLDDTGHIFTGCNVENASYGLSICAERNAIAHAVNAGSRHFQAIAIAADHAVPPCGACRQVLAEFMAPDALVFAIGRDEQASVTTWRVGELLPAAFSFEPSS